MHCVLSNAAPSASAFAAICRCWIAAVVSSLRPNAIANSKRTVNKLGCKRTAISNSRTGPLSGKLQNIRRDGQRFVFAVNRPAAK